VVNKQNAHALPTLAGQVVSTHGKHFQIELADGRMISCVTRGKKTGTACGDRVEIKLTGPDQGVIESIAPRSSLLYRSDPFKEKIIAANVTQIVIVAAGVPTFYEEFLNRCLVAAESADIRAIIALNKIDLPEAAALRIQLAPYAALGYELLPLCARQDVSTLRAQLLHHTSVLVGQSGMGKSTLVNGLLPEARAKEGDISVALDSGKHTTTHATLYHLDADSHIIDSPGMQAFGLHHLSVEQLADAFPEFRAHIGHCRFSNCRHLSEPDCAISAAAAAGTITRDRLAFYRLFAEENLRAPRLY
jgi:ribosome biogenesis GTPase / thiamine phosphate phosphatase